MAGNLVILENTRFIFQTNFAGDPRADKYGSDARKGNIIINDRDIAKQLIDEGFNVKMTRPRDEEDESDFIPDYFITVKMNFDSKWPPKVFLMTDALHGVLLDVDSVREIDAAWVDKVNVVLNKYENRLTGRKSFYVKSMEVYQRVDDDPIARRHMERMQRLVDAVQFNPDNEDDGNLPF